MLPDLIIVVRLPSERNSFHLEGEETEDQRVEVAKIRALEIRKVRFKTRPFPSPKPFASVFVPLPHPTSDYFLYHPPLLVFFPHL